MVDKLQPDSPEPRDIASAGERWLVSYEYEACYLGERGVRHNAPVRTVVILDEHPARYFARLRVAYNALTSIGYNPKAPLERADDVRCIFAAIPVPPGLLTADEIEALS